MKSLLVLLALIGSLQAGAQNREHPVDFDDSFFKRSPYSRWMRDPFKNPPGFVKGAAGKASWPALTAVNLKGKVASVTLDGREFTEGQFIDEDRYIAVIGQNFVIITEGNFDYELVLADPKKGVAGASGGKK